MRWIGWGLVCFCLGWSVQAVSAQAATFTISDSAPIPTEASTVFSLDQGFVGRPVTLEAMQGHVKIQWNAGDLLAAATLTVNIDKESTSSVDGFDLADRAIQLSWDDRSRIASRGPSLTFTDCVSGALTECALFQQQPEGWGKVSGWNVTSSAPVRLGVKRWTYMREGIASWYAYKHCLCAASPDFPKGTKLRIRSVQDPNKSVVITVNDWGPDRKVLPNRAIDLDKVAFKKLAPRGAGLLRVTIEPVRASDPVEHLAIVPPQPVKSSPEWKY